MTERERWVVYPLLFLALGVSLRDKLGGRLTSKIIACQELVIEDEPVGGQEPRRLAVLGRAQPNPNSPAVALLELNGEVAVNGVVNVSDHYAIRGLPINFNFFQIVPRDVSPRRTVPPAEPTDNKASPSKGDSTKNPRAADKPATDAAPQN